MFKAAENLALLSLNFSLFHFQESLISVNMCYNASVIYLDGYTGPTFIAILCFCFFFQMVLQDPKTGSQYSFELKDRIIRDDDHDGWIEIPVKPSVDEDDQEGKKTNENNSSSSSAKPLPGDRGGIVFPHIRSCCQTEYYRLIFL